MRFLLIFLLVFPMLSHASEVPDSFRHLKELSLPGGASIFYNDKTTSVINKEIKGSDLSVLYGESIRAIRTLIDSSKKNQYYTIDFEPGPDAGSFMIYLEKDGVLKKVLSIDNYQLFVPGNGFIYASGNFYRMFDERTKIKIEGGKFEVVKQPFLYVGIETKISRDIEIYSSKNQKNRVAKLPKGSYVQVVLSDGDHYLLKTPFGLLGWFYLKKSDAQDHTQSPLPDIWLHGD